VTPLTTPTDTDDRKAMYRIPEAMLLLSMSRTVIYQEMRAGRLRYVRQGTDRRITAGAISEYVALLEREALERAA
jgi:predicted DNA-binding transcriptional regulator AlpA